MTRIELPARVLMWAAIFVAVTELIPPAVNTDLGGKGLSDVLAGVGVLLAAGDSVFPVSGGTGVFAKVKSGTLVSKNYDADGDATDVTIKLRF